MANKSKVKTTKVPRSAVTGQFITMTAAKKHPKTTVVETVTKKKRKR